MQADVLSMGQLNKSSGAKLGNSLSQSVTLFPSDCLAHLAWFRETLAPSQVSLENVSLHTIVLLLHTLVSTAPASLLSSW